MRLSRSALTPRMLAPTVPSSPREISALNSPTIPPGICPKRVCSTKARWASMAPDRTKSNWPPISDHFHSIKRPTMSINPRYQSRASKKKTPTPTRYKSRSPRCMPTGPIRLVGGPAPRMSAGSKLRIDNKTTSAIAMRISPPISRPSAIDRAVDAPVEGVESFLDADFFLEVYFLAEDFFAIDYFAASAVVSVALLRFSVVADRSEEHTSELQSRPPLG